MIEIRKFEPDDTDTAIKIWNEVVDDGVAFPQLDELDHESGLAFFEEQTYTGIAVDSDTNEIVGLYIYIQTMLADVVISVMQVMRFLLLTVESRSANFLSQTVSNVLLNLILRSFSLMRLLQVIKQPCIYTRNLDLSSLV